ncbi:MAG TPA: hypothetical protein VKI17_14005 [Gemmataceae bacterium]|nr:hypothetical protein [Gemmataceae bacterium]
MRTLQRLRLPHQLDVSLQVSGLAEGVMLHRGWLNIHAADAPPPEERPASESDRRDQQPEPMPFAHSDMVTARR